MINHEDPSTQSLSPDSSVMLPLAMIGIPRSIQWCKSIQENRASVVQVHHLQFVLNAQPPCPRLVGCTVKEPMVMTMMTQRFTRVNSSQNLRRRAWCNRCISLAQTNKTRTKPASTKRCKKMQKVSRCLKSQSCFDRFDSDNRMEKVSKHEKTACFCTDFPRIAKARWTQWTGSG